MATYKVLQDIEAEDKLLGPLTLKQFIFAAIFVGLGFLQFTIITSGAPSVITAPFVMIILPFMLIFGFLAAPIGRDQPNDLWLLARMRFLFKPRRRIWNQDGLSELVTITAPKRVTHKYTDGLAQDEVKSRLQALASTMDSRGWAVKNVNTNLFAQPGYLTDDSGSDRLVAASTLPQQDFASDVQAADDMLDANNNETAQNFERLVQESSQSHRTKALDKMKGQTNQTQQTQDYWFMNQTQPPAQSVPQDYSTFQNQTVVHPGTDDNQSVTETAEEKELAHKLAEQNSEQLKQYKDHMKTVQPLHDRDGNIVKQPTTTTPATSQPTQADTTITNLSPPEPTNTQQKQPNPAIINLANNDDLNISTIARQAKQTSEGDDEVVISLH